MRPVLVDSNVLLDVVTADPTWAEWSSAALATAADEAVLVINAIVYGEVSVGFDSKEDLDAALPTDGLRTSRDPGRSGVPGWQMLPRLSAPRRRTPVTAA